MLLSPTLLDLTIALGLLLPAIALSAWQRLGLEWPLLIATGRSALQLTIAGYVFTALFLFQTVWATLGMIGLLLILATVFTRNRLSPRSPRLGLTIAASLFTGMGLTLLYVSLFVLRQSPWYAPQYLVPLAGLVIGHGMNAAAIAAEQLLTAAQHNRVEIETHLSLGASPAQAIAPYRHAAIRAGMSATLNTLTIVALVTLPGSFNGQLLSGTLPLDAAAYQMIILWMLATATLTTVVLLTTELSRQMFNSQAQLQINDRHL